jgi:hypothetical protein
MNIIAGLIPIRIGNCGFVIGEFPLSKRVKGTAVEDAGLSFSAIAVLAIVGLFSTICDVGKGVIGISGASSSV